MIGTNDFMHTLAWSLLHFLWQGAAIAAIAAACMFVFRRPATRYLVGLSALALMLASFVVTFALLSGPAGSRIEETAPAASLTLPLQASADSVRHFIGEPGASAPADFLWIARGWLVGVCAFALRIAFGLLLLEYLRRRNLVALPAALVERFRALQQRLGIRRAIRYCECQMLRVPAVIGIFRPIVLLPMRALTGLTAEQLEAVIAHELGHIKRLDVAVNFFQVIAETLFFFHPAVWWLNRRIRADREDCCDDVAIEACGETVGYARALATMETWRDAPPFAMAATGSPVAARVARLLGITPRDTGSRAAGVVTASLVLATALIAGAVSIGVANPALAQSTGVSLDDLIVQIDTSAPVVSVQPNVDVEPKIDIEAVVKTDVAVEVEQVEEVQQTEEVKRTEKAVRAPKPLRAPKPPREPKAPQEPKPPKPPREASYIDEMKAVGFSDLDVDRLIEMKVVGVTPDYVREIRSVGLSPEVNALVAMKVHGITPAYVKEIRALGFTPESHQFVEMKIHGITPEYVRGMRDLGINPDAGEFINLKVQSVTPEYVREMRAAGFNADTQELIAMKVHDVTPEYQQALAKAGYKMNVSETIAAKVMGVTPEFIEKVRAGGFRNMTVDKLIQLKNADIL